LGRGNWLARLPVEKFHPITDQSQRGGHLIVDNLEYQETITVWGNFEFWNVQFEEYTNIRHFDSGSRETQACSIKEVLFAHIKQLMAVPGPVRPMTVVL
jgi:hypothetical protein